MKEEVKKPYNRSIKKTLISKKEFASLKKLMIYTENNLINSDGNIYLTVDSLIKLNHVITGSNKFTLGKVRLNAYEF